jgi:hypothetical protein
VLFRRRPVTLVLERPNQLAASLARENDFVNISISALSRDVRIGELFPEVSDLARRAPPDLRPCPVPACTGCRPRLPPHDGNLRAWPDQWTALANATLDSTPKPLAEAQLEAPPLSLAVLCFRGSAVITTRQCTAPSSHAASAFRTLAVIAPKRLAAPRNP